MKINRLTRVIAVVLVLTMLPLWMLGCGKATSRVSDKLVELMVGDGKLSDKNEDSAEYLTKLDAEVEYLKTYFSKEGFWDKQWMEPETSIEATHYKNIYKCATAWATKGSEHYHSSKVMSIIKKALEYGYANIYGEAQKSQGEGGYSWTERCDIAEYLVRSLLILKENNKLSGRKIEDYSSVVGAKFAVPYSTGVTLARTSYIVIGQSALIGDEEKIAYVIGTLAASAALVTADSGLYADGSYVADTKVAASGSYGVTAFSEMVEIAYAVQGEEFDFAPEVKIADYIYNWAVNSIVPSLYNGRAFVSGAASYTEQAELLGGRAVSSMLALAIYFDELDDSTKATELRAIVKGYAANEKSDFHAYLTSFGAVEYADIAEDEKIAPKTVNGAFSFTVTDRLNVLGTAYSASLSLSSLRTAKYETRANRFPDEKEERDESAHNGDGWYTGDGMLMIYTNEYAPGNNYWKYVKATRIPGTTVDSRDRTMTESDGYTGTNYYAGSAVNGNFAVSAYNFVNNNSELTSVGLSAKKSWFFLDNEIVALGTGINNPKDTFATQGYAIETIVENIYVGKYTSICTSTNQADDRTLAKNKVEVAPNAFYVLGYGGIYVPADKNDVLKYTLNVTDGGNFIEVWLDHSPYVYNEEGDYDEPVPEVYGKSYEYALVPSTAMNMNDFFAYTQTPGYKVLSNSEQVQAVADISSGVEEYVFWEAASCVNGAATRNISTSFACDVIIRETATQVIVTVADFTQTASAAAGTVDIGVTGAVDAAATSAGLTLNGTVISVDRNVAANGQSLTIVINK